MDQLSTIGRIEHEIAQHERKALDSLARYKFWMFGYHAAQWVMLTRVSGLARPNPLKPLVKLARDMMKATT